MENAVPVAVFSSINFSEADFVKTRLQDHGIKAWVTDPVAQYPHALAQVYVASADQTVAHSVVEEWARRSTPA